MKKINKYIIALSAAAILASCTHEFPEPVVATSGTADFTKLVSVGNSLTAGYLNGALYTAGQDNSFPSIIAQQMQGVGGGNFNQPDINSQYGFFGTAGTTILGRLRLVGTTPTPFVPGDIPTAYGGDKSALNNFGVPGVTLLTALIPATGGPDIGAANPAYNPLYARFASNPSADGATGSTLIGDAAAALADNGTFFTFWLGNNDVLGYATGGASNPAILTSAGDFDSRLQSALGAMLAANSSANGAVANIPSVSDVPFFTVVPWNPLPLDAATAAGTNAAFAAYNGGLAAALGATIITQAEHDLRVINYVGGQNGFLIEDDELTDVATLSGGAIPIPKYRLTNSTDLVVLPAAGVLGTLADPNNPSSVYGVGVAMGDEHVVTTAELTEINASVTAFNASIASMVDANSDRLVLVDVNTIFSNLVANGASVNGSGLDASFIPPFGAFSVDGVHPNSRGYAYIANRFIEAINGKFNSDIPLVNPNNYAGNELPE